MMRQVRASSEFIIFFKLTQSYGRLLTPSNFHGNTNTFSGITTYRVRLQSSAIIPSCSQCDPICWQWSCFLLALYCCYDDYESVMITLELVNSQNSKCAEFGIIPKLNECPCAALTTEKNKVLNF